MLIFVFGKIQNPHIHNFDPNDSDYESRFGMKFTQLQTAKLITVCYNFSSQGIMVNLHRIQAAFDLPSFV